MNANPQSDHPPQTCSSTPNKHVSGAPKTSLFGNKWGPNLTPKTVSSLSDLNRKGPKAAPFFWSMGGTWNKISGRKKTVPRNQKNTHLRHQNLLHLSSRTQFKSKPRGGRERTGGIKYTRQMPPHLLPDFTCGHWLPNMQTADKAGVFLSPSLGPFPASWVCVRSHIPQHVVGSRPTRVHIVVMLNKTFRPDDETSAVIFLLHPRS